MSGIDTPDWMDEDNQENPQVPAQPGTEGAIPQGSGLANPKLQRKASTGFVNLRKYIQANQGNNLAEKVVNPAQQKLQTANQNLQSAQQAFQTGLENERAKLQGAASNAQQGLNYVDTGMGLAEIGQAPAAFTKIKPTDTFAPNYAADLEQYNKDLTEYKRQSDEYQAKANEQARQKLLGLKNYSYAGPRELDNADQLNSDKFAINDFANATTNEAGRGAILQTVFGKGGNYTAGARNLDNLLLGGNQDNLSKLRSLRTQSTNFGQNLERANQQAASKLGSAMGNVDIEKAKQAMLMKNLRDSMRARLEAEAATYNTQNQADAAQVDIEELKKWLPEMAGYELTKMPGIPATSGGAVMKDPNAIRKSNLEMPMEPTDDQLAVNLYQNKGFEEYQKVDPYKIISKSVTQGGGLGHRDYNHSVVGRPNTVEAYVGAESLKPLFQESYTDNTWDSINKDALLRRNLLSEILADNANDGILTPKEKQELQVSLNQPGLENLKSIPTAGEDAYINNFYQTTNQSAVNPMINAINNPTEYGFKNAREATDFFGVDPLWANPAFQADRAPLARFFGNTGMHTVDAPSRIASLLRNKAIVERLKQLGVSPDKMLLKGT